MIIQFIKSPPTYQIKTHSVLDNFSFARDLTSKSLSTLKTIRKGIKNIIFLGLWFRIH